jgi:hypothetical protein
MNKKLWLLIFLSFLLILIFVPGELKYPDYILELGILTLIFGFSFFIVYKILVVFKVKRKRALVIAVIFISIPAIYLGVDIYFHSLNFDIDKSSISYKVGYSHMQKKIKKKGLIFKYPDFAYQHGASTIELKLSKEYGYIYFNYFPDFPNHSYAQGLEDGYLDYVKSKFGADFMERAKLKSEALNKELNINYYKDSLQIIANTHFTKRIIKDNKEVGEFDLKWVEETPFIFQLNLTSYEKSRTDVYTTGKTMFFTDKAQYEGKNLNTLPSLSFIVFWKPDSKFPFKDIPFTQISLN